MSHLVPCPSCARHVRQSEVSCPFCSAEVSLGHLPPPALPRIRLGRAATFAFGASLVGVTSLVGCGGTSEEGKEGGAGESNGGNGTVTPVYGAPAAGMAGQQTFGGTPAYGGPAPNGGAVNGGAGGSGGMANGGAGDDESAGAGGDANANAGSGGRNIMPVYGAPPMPPQD